MEKSIAYVFNSEPDWGGPHICHRALDRLAGYVNDGILQTVVDQVYTPVTIRLNCPRQFNFHK